MCNLKTRKSVNDILSFFQPSKRRKSDAEALNSPCKSSAKLITVNFQLGQRSSRIGVSLFFVHNVNSICADIGFYIHIS